MFNPKYLEAMKMLGKRNNTDFLPGIFNDMFGGDWFDNRYVRSNVPAVNVKENEDGYELEMAAPGMKKEDFNIKLEKNILTISYEKKTENSESNNGYTRKEFSYDSFQRSFVLPDTVDAEKINGRYKDGILKLEIAKKEEAKDKAPRTIKIS